MTFKFTLERGKGFYQLQIHLYADCSIGVAPQQRIVGYHSSHGPLVREACVYLQI